MDKQKVQLIVIAAGLAILVLALVSNFKGAKANKPAAPATNPPATAAGAVAAVSAAPVADAQNNEQQKKQAELAWGRDPFLSQLDDKEQLSELKLQGISFGKDKSGFVFINNEIFKKGDKIGEYEVVEVFKDKVMLRKDQQTFYLTFPEE